MKRSLTLASGLWLLVAPAAHALVDANSNGISDLWERLYNAGQLFSAANPDHAPNADPDGDGWNNAQEATAGTNPFDAKSPEGMLSPAVARTPAIIEPAPPGANLGQPDPDPTSGHTLEIRRPARFSLTWPTVEGKAYGIFQSADLEAWSPASDFFMGEGNPLTYQGEAINTDYTEPDKLFYRIKVEEADSDGDNLTDYEEGLLGTDPFSTDTDRDGIADGTEYSGGGDPLVNTLSIDPDGGGLPASLATGLIGRWDLEETYIAASQGPYYTLARYADAVGTNPIVPFHTQPKAHGMPSKGAGATTPNPVGYLCPPRALLNNRKTYSVSMWVKLEQASITLARPLASLFSHHRRQNKPAPYQSQYRIDVNGTWIERLANGTQVIKAGTYNYINYTPGTNQQINGVVTFTGVTSAPFAAGVLDDGKYHHYLLVRANAVVSLYRDGQLIGTNPSVTPAAIDTPGDPDTGISFGRFYGPPAEQGLPSTDPQAAAASFDRLRVWSRSITAAEALSLYRQDLDSDGLWDITESRTRLWRDTNSDATEQDSEHAFVSSPYIWQPSSADTDGDGLTDTEEQTIGTEIHDSDTDDDRLPDGFEVKYGLNPFVATGADGPDGDPDGDGLTNLREYNFNSKPKALPGDPALGQPFSAADSDGDGTGDLLEANGGSHPGYASDGGQAIPASERITLKIGIGDNSGSHSEDYSAICHRINPETGEEEEYYTVHSGGFGQFKEETLPIFQKGQTYTFQIRWNGSDNSTRSASPGVTAEGPDFDYTFKVEPQGADTGFLIDGYNPKYGIADLSKPLLAQDANDVAETQQEFQQEYQNRRVVLMGVSAVSADRMFGASMQVLPGLEDIQLEFTNTVTNEDFGTHSQLFASAYTDLREMYGAGDDFGNDIADARVWFIQRFTGGNPSIQAYLTGDPSLAHGAIRIEATLGGQALGSISKALTPDADFAALITITTDIASGAALNLVPGVLAPPPATVTGTLLLPPHQLTTAMRIPMLILQEYGQQFTIAYNGLLDGIVGGLKDDYEFLKLVVNFAYESGKWSAEHALELFNVFLGDRVVLIRQITEVCYNYFRDQVSGPVSAYAGQAFSSPGNFIDTMWNAAIYGTNAYLATQDLLTRGVWEYAADGIVAWFDDFSIRMIAATERYSWAENPFPRNSLSAELTEGGRIFIYTTNYCVGYIAEQVAVGYVTGGATVIGKTLAVNGAKHAGKLATRTAAVIAVRTSVIKKRLSGEMSHALANATEEAVGTAASRLAPGTTVKTQTAAVIEEGMERLRPPPLPGAIPTGPTWNDLVKEIASQDNLKKILLDPAKTDELLQATALMYQRATADLTKEGAANWPKLINRLVKENTNGTLETRFDDLFAFFKADTPEGAKSLSKSLNAYTDPAGKFWVKDVEKVYSSLYHHLPESGFSRLELRNGSIYLTEFAGERGWYVTGAKIDTQQAAKDLLQLPAIDNGRYRCKFSTVQAKDNLKVPRGNQNQSEAFELLTKDFSENGSGGETQMLLEAKEALVDEVFDTVEQRALSSSEIQQLISP